MSEEQHPLSTTLPDGTEITLSGQRVRVLGLVQQLDGLVHYTVQDQQSQHHRLLKIARPADDNQQYEHWKLALEHEAAVLNQLRASNAEAAAHVPRCYQLAEAHIVVERVEHIYPVALLTDALVGERVDQFVHVGAGLGEHSGLRIGGQLAQVLGLVHQAGYSWGAGELTRLVWDSTSQHMTVIDWYTAEHLAALNLSPEEELARKQQDARALALLIPAIISGQAPAEGGGALAHLTDDLSVPLFDALERVIDDPRVLGEQPAQRLLQELNRLLAYWDTPDLFARAERSIAEVRERKQTADPRLMHVLAEQIAIGKRKEPDRPWQRLTANSEDVLVQPLEQIRSAIVAGQFRQALRQVKSLVAPPSLHYQVLFRQRLAEAGVADDRLANDTVFAHYRSAMGQSIKAWDAGDYRFPEWLQQIGSIFTQVVLAPEAQAALQRLGYELRIAAAIDRFEQATNDIEARLAAIDTLEKLSPLPQGIDARMAERCRQLSGARTRLIDQQQSEKMLQPLERRVNMGDPTLSKADFEQVVRQGTSTEFRQKVYDVEARWKSIQHIRSLPEHGDVAEAVRQFARLPRAIVQPALLAELESLIGSDLLRRVGIYEPADTLSGAFDRILNLPKRALEDLVLHRRWLYTLLPVVDTSRRSLYDNLLTRESQIRKNLELLDASSTASRQAQLDALEDLRRQGIISLQHLYLRVISQAEIQRDQEDYQNELIAQLEKTLNQLRAFSTDRPDIPYSLSDDVTEIKQGILSSQTTGLKERHRRLWDQTSHFAPVYQELYYQQLYFTAQQAALDFKKLWNAEGRDSAPTLAQPERLDRLIEAAAELQRLAAMLSNTDYRAKVASFINEQCDMLDNHIYTLLRTDGRPTLERQAADLARARRYVAVYEALSGEHSTPAFFDQTAITALLSEPNPTLRRLALPYLPLDIDEEQVARLLENPQTGLVLVNPGRARRSWWRLW